MSVSISLRGSNRVANNLRRLARELPRLTDRIVGDFAKRMRRQLKSTPYPPKRPGQTYIRTGRLASSWRAERVKVGHWRVTNSQDYARWVVGLKQAWMHVGRWWIAQEEVAKEAPELTKELSKAYRQRWQL